MKALFKELPAFSRVRADYLTDNDFRGLQNMLMANPLAGDVIEGRGAYARLAMATHAGAKVPEAACE